MAATYVTEAELRANLQLGNLYSSATVEEVCQAAENIIKSYLWFNDYNVIARECTTTLATIYTDTIHDIQLGQIVTVEKLQRIIVSELYKIAFVHLYIQGYRDESLTNFELSLTTPSIIYDQERVMLLKEKMFYLLVVNPYLFQFYRLLVLKIIVEF